MPPFRSFGQLLNKTTAWPLLVVVLLLGACAKQRGSSAGQDASQGRLTKVRLQTDWFPQAEQGGFYQALAKGYYKEEGLDVELLPGGPGAHIKAKVLGGDAEFGMNSAIDLVVATGKGMRFTMIAPFLQHDHQGLMVHAASPVRSFKDLEGRTLLASPGMAWIEYLKKKYDLHFNVQPLPYGLAQFVGDPGSVRQCVVTNEPFLAAREGLDVRVLPLADAGYDNYHVLFCRPAYILENRRTVKAFIKASLRGWKDYAEGDPKPAHDLILTRNREMSIDFLNYSRGKMLEHGIIGGSDPSKGGSLGKFTPQRVADTCRLVKELGMTESLVRVEEVADFSLLPEQP